MGSTSSLCVAFCTSLLSNTRPKPNISCCSRMRRYGLVMRGNVNASASKRSMASGVVYTAASGV